MIGAIEITVMEWSVFVNDAWLFLPFLAYFGFILLLTIDLKFKPNTTKWMRNLSILIYILHSVFQYFNSLFGIKNGMLMFLLTTLECIVFSGLFIFLSEKFTILKKFY